MFDTSSLPSALRGLTPELIEDLYDLIAKYGADIDGVSMRRLTRSAPRPLYLTAVVPPATRRNITVGPMPGGVIANQCAIVLFDPPPHSVIFWDLRVTLLDVLEFMKSVDAEMDMWREPLTGARRRKVCDRYEKATISVDLVFDKPGKGICLEGITDPDQAMKMFDRPEDVAVLGSGKEGLIVCRAADLPLAKRREERRDGIIAGVLARWGLREPKDTNALSKPDLERLLAEVKAALAAESEDKE